MVERNPYEANSPVDVPSFMKEDKEEKEKVNMNVFKLKDEEIGDEEDEEDEEDERESSARKPVTSKTLLTVALVAALLLATVCAILYISRNSAYNSLKSEYETYQATSDKKVERLESQIETLNKEIETLKTAQAETKSEDTASSDSSSSSSSGSSTTTTTTTTGSFKAGTYKVVASMYVRSGAGSGNAVVQQKDMPIDIQYITNDNSTVVEGEEVKVIEVQTSGDEVWGKIGEGCWICLKNSTGTLVK